MKKLLNCFLCALWLLIPAIAYAQEKTVNTSPTLVDEFDNYTPVSAVIAILEVFAQALQNEPSSRAYIVIYRYRSELPGQTVRALDWAKLYIISNRRVEANRIVLVDGGVVSCPSTELWLVPEGTTPKIKENIYRQNFEDGNLPRKFDEYYFEFGKLYIEIETAYGRIYVNSLRAFADEIKKEEGMSAYIIVYPQYENRNNRQMDAPGTAAKMIERIQSDLINNYKLKRSKIKVVNGGYRKMRQVELWILPRGAHPPVATPNAFPKIIQKRKKIKK